MSDNITLPRATVEQALEALESVEGKLWRPWSTDAARAAAALRAALARPSPATLAEPVEPVEPVAWMTHGDDLLPLFHKTKAGALAWGSEPQPLYTAPPQRKPLTDDEIVNAVREADLDWHSGWTLDDHEPNRFTTLARAVERKVRGEEE